MKLEKISKIILIVNIQNYSKLEDTPTTSLLGLQPQICFGIIFSNASVTSQLRTSESIDMNLKLCNPFYERTLLLLCSDIKNVH